MHPPGLCASYLLIFMRPWILTASSMHSALWTVRAFFFLQPKWLRPISASSAIFLFRSLSWTAITMSLDYDCVLINNIQGAFNATNYLIQCGHKNVGYFHSSLDISNFSGTRRRLLQSAPCKRHQHLASICSPGFPDLGRRLPRHAAPSRIESSDRGCLLCR